MINTQIIFGENTAVVKYCGFVSCDQYGIILRVPKIEENIKALVSLMESELYEYKATKAYYQFTLDHDKYDQIENIS